MRCELSLQPLSAIQPFPESRPLLEAVQAGSNVWDEGAKQTDSSRTRIVFAQSPSPRSRPSMALSACPMARER
jgi:hypothetical protein